MKVNRALIIFIAVNMSVISIPCAMGAQGDSGGRTRFLKVPLTGVVTENVPKTPEEVGRYLMQMRNILDRYQELVVNTLLGTSGTKVKPNAVGAARDQLVAMIRTIHAITPPAQLKARHDQLATMLAEVDRILQNPGGAFGNVFVALEQLGPLVNRVRDTLASYHVGVKNCLSYYHLGPEYDPFAGNHDQSTSRLGAAFNNMQTKVLSGQQESDNFSSGSYPSMTGENQNARQTPSGGLGGLDLSAFGLGNIDPSMLQQFGSVMSGGRGSSGGLGSLLQGGQGSSGGLDSGHSGGSSEGGSTLFDSQGQNQVQQLMQQLQGQ